MGRLNKRIHRGKKYWFETLFLNKDDEKGQGMMYVETFGTETDNEVDETPLSGGFSEVTNYLGYGNLGKSLRGCGNIINCHNF